MAAERKRKTRTKTGIALMTFGLLLIAAAVSLFAYNRIEENRGRQRAQAALEAIENLADDAISENENGENSAIIDGEKYIGVISIPSVGINLAVQADYSLEKLKNAPGRYSGDVIDGSIIICAHNYEGHFGSLKYAEEGDKAYFTDVRGLTYSYKITSSILVDGYDIEKMNKDDGWDMTLFTCTYSGRQRQTLRLVRTDVY